MQEEKNDQQELADLTPDLIEAAAYQRWIRDRIPPESPYPWYIPDGKIPTDRKSGDSRAAI